MKEENAEKNLEIGEVISKSELFLQKYQKTIIAVVIAVLVIIVAIFGIKKWVIEPRENAANEQIFAAENWFGMDNYELALNGNEKFVGFAAVADQYGSTKAGKRAKYCAGICELRLGKYDEAIKYFNSYNGKDTFTKAQCQMLLGDAYFEKGDINKAVSQYEKAISMSNDELVAPAAMLKAGFAYMELGNKDKAKAQFEAIKTQYPTSTENAEVDRYIALIEYGE